MEFIVNNSFFTGKFLIHLPSVDSTNDYAKDYMANTSPIDGTVILADEQFAGRGQAGNSWIADANANLTFSLIYHTSFLRATEQFYLNMAVCLGVQSMVNSQWLMENDAQDSKKEECVSIKWPNDIYVKDEKIAGILIENTISCMHLKYSVIGIGLNVNQTVFPQGIRASSLRSITGKERDRNKVLNEVLSSIEKYFLLLKERKFETLKQKYLQHLYRIHMEARYKKEERIFTARIVDVNEAGNLLMETDEGVTSFNFKEISFVS